MKTLSKRILILVGIAVLIFFVRPIIYHSYFNKTWYLTKISNPQQLAWDFNTITSDTSIAKSLLNIGEITKGTIEPTLHLNSYQISFKPGLIPYVTKGFYECSGGPFFGAFSYSPLGKIKILECRFTYAYAQSGTNFNFIMQHYILGSTDIIQRGRDTIIINNSYSNSLTFSSRP